jgi:tetratricopeptide (TPR) repeat protein
VGLGEYQKAIKDASQALQINPNLALAYNNRSAARLELGEYQKAIEDASQALQINPNLGLAYYNRGISHYKLGNEQAGDEDLEKAGEIFLYQAGSQVAQSLIRELLQ